MEETKIANQIINDDFPEMMNDKQKMVLKKLIIEELSLNNHDFDEVYKIFDEYLHNENSDPESKLYKNIRKTFKIMKVVKDF